MKKQNLPTILGIGLLSLAVFIGLGTLLNRNRHCLKCGQTRLTVTEDRVTCPICSKTYWVCQESHWHCSNPSCRMVGVNHQTKCSRCEVEHFSCEIHICDSPRRKGQDQNLSPTDTIPRPPVEGTLTDR